jgi:hypothetical protein
MRVKRDSNVACVMIQSFIHQTNLTTRHFHPSKIIYRGETSWEAVDNRMRTVAIAGIEGVTTLFSGDPKACLTVFVAIGAAASKLHV